MQITDRLRQTEPTQAKAALKNVVSIIANGPTSDEARAIINEMERYEGYILVWLNGELVHGKNTSRGMAPGQYMVDIKLRQGPNDLKLKVIDNEGGWAFACRVRNRNGSAVNDPRIEAK